MTAEQIRIDWYGKGDSRAHDDDELNLMKAYGKTISVQWKKVEDVAILFNTEYLLLREWTDGKKKGVRTVDVGSLYEIISRESGKQYMWCIGADYDISDVTHLIEIPQLPEPYNKN